MSIPTTKGNPVATRAGSTSGKTPARERIIEAACMVLSVQGSHEASIKEIAKAAGVAPGLVHYYFATKVDLLLEVVRSCCQKYNDEVMALQVPSDPHERTRFLLEWTKKRGLEGGDWFRLMAELDAMALRDTDLAREVSALRSDIRLRTTAMVASVLNDLNTELPAGTEALASVLVAAVDGLTVHKLLDNQFDIDGAIDALFQLLIATTASNWFPKAQKT